MLPSPPILTQRGITLVETLVAIGITIFLAMLLMPLMGNLTGHTRNATCMGNLRQIFSACLAYRAEHVNQWPRNEVGTPSIIFATTLEPYLGPYPEGRRATESYKEQKSVLICPADRFGPSEVDRLENAYRVGGYGLSYAQNGYVTSPNGAYRSGPPASVVMPSRLAVYMDWEGHFLASPATLTAGEGLRLRALKKRHNGRINVLFADGHLESLDAENLPSHTPPPEPFWAGRSSTDPRP